MNKTVVCAVGLVLLLGGGLYYTHLIKTADVSTDLVTEPAMTAPTTSTKSGTRTTPGLTGP